MKKLLLIIALCISTASTAQIKWYNPMEAGAEVHGQGWAELRHSYVRLPAHAEGKAPKAVWNLSRHSAGLSLVFQSNAKEIIVRYQVTGGYNMFHMPSTGVSGVDMYATDADGRERWCAPHFPVSFADTIKYHYDNITYFTNPKQGYEYHMYLPLYNGVKWMEIGVPADAQFEFLPVSPEKPIVVYGTSIAHGACASRPGLAWTNIVERRTSRPMVNLGFSGSGKLEPGMFDLLSEIKASLYVIDCMANMDSLPDLIIERIVNGVHRLRQTSSTPILLVEHAGYTGEFTNQQRSSYKKVNQLLRQAYEQLQAEGIADLHYMTTDEIGLDQESQVESVHPNDHGMRLHADAHVRQIVKILH